MRKATTRRVEESGERPSKRRHTEEIRTGPPPPPPPLSSSSTSSLSQPTTRRREDALLNSESESGSKGACTSPSVASSTASTATTEVVPSPKVGSSSSRSNSLGCGGARAPTPATPRLDSRDLDPGEDLRERYGMRVGLADARNDARQAFMEDVHLVISDLEAHLFPERQTTGRGATTVWSMFGVLDGHGGVRAAEYAAQNLPGRVFEELGRRGLGATATSGTISGQQAQRLYCEAISEAFIKTDEGLLEEADKALCRWKDGSTANVVLMVDGVDLYVANVGDCRAVLARTVDVADTQQEDGPVPMQAAVLPSSVSVAPSVLEDGREQEEQEADGPGLLLAALPLSKDHTASDEDERRRIVSMGGRVDGGRVSSKLEVSRSFGDITYKRGGGVVCTPDITCHTIGPRDRFLVVASDGLWKYVSSQEAVDFVYSRACRQQRQRRPLDMREIATALVSEAIDKRRSHDNVTVIIVWFPNEPHPAVRPNLGLSPAGPQAQTARPPLARAATSRQLQPWGTVDKKVR